VGAIEALLVKNTAEGLVGRRGRGQRLAGGRSSAGRRALAGLALVLLLGSDAILGSAHGEAG
jgi:hypothetical protein